MPKRSAEEKVAHYYRKIRKLEEKKNKRRRKRINVISSDEDEIITDTINEEQKDHGSPTSPEPPPPPPSMETPQEEDIGNIIQVPEGSPTEVSEPVLDPELVSALGIGTTVTPDFGEPIHDSLANLWTPFLIKGLPKDEKSNLMKEYLIPSNCKLLQAPKLNPEISVAISEVVRGRDKKLESFQQMLGTSTSAINRAMDILLKTNDKVQALKSLSDGCRLLSDLHYAFSCDRKKLITPSLEKSFFHLIQDCERDDTLFGNTLADKIKASKAIERQGLQIRRVPNQKTVTSTFAYVGHPLCSAGKLDGTSSLPISQGSGTGGSTEVSDCTPTSISRNNDIASATQAFEADKNSCKSATIIQGVSPPTRESYPGCREALRSSFSRRGAPPEALALMLSSLSENTLKQYNVTLKLWWQFCSINNINVFNNSISLVLSFLSKQFNMGCSYGSLNSHRSALSLLLGDSIGSDDRIKRLLKGAYRLKPSRPKYSYTWDPQLVLNFIGNWYPNIELSLEKITKKLVILLALCTAHRVQTLSLIKLSNIIITSNSIKIAISNTLKNSAPGREQPILLLPYFRENLNICPASVLKDYIFVTKDLRTMNADHLLITLKRPHKAATAQSISRWIKQVLSESGVDTGMFSAHSTRHASTSAASFAGLSVDTIRRTAGWTSASMTFARFYNRPIKDASEGDFARAVVFPPRN